MHKNKANLYKIFLVEGKLSTKFNSQSAEDSALQLAQKEAEKIDGGGTFFRTLVLKELMK